MVGTGCVVVTRWIQFLTLLGDIITQSATHVQLSGETNGQGSMPDNITDLSAKKNHSKKKFVMDSAVLKGSTSGHRTRCFVASTHFTR